MDLPIRLQLGSSPFLFLNRDGPQSVKKLSGSSLVSATLADLLTCPGIPAATPAYVDGYRMISVASGTGQYSGTGIDWTRRVEALWLGTSPSITSNITPSAIVPGAGIDFYFDASQNKIAIRTSVPIGQWYYSGAYVAPAYIQPGAGISFGWNGSNTITVNANFSGTTNYVAKFTGTNTISSSKIFDDGYYIGIGINSNLTARATVNGSMMIYASALGTETYSPRDNGELLYVPSGAGHLVNRQQWGYADRAITYQNVAASTTRAPKTEKYCRQYSAASPTAFTYDFSTAIFGVAAPANEVLYGTLLVAHRYTSTATSGWCALYTFVIVTNGSGQATNAWISNTALEANYLAVKPTVTITIPDTTHFRVNINDTAGGSGAVAGYFELQYGFCSS